MVRGRHVLLSQAMWRRAPFRDVPRRVDVCFLDDHPEAVKVTLSGPELYVVCHDSHTWTRIVPQVVVPIEDPGGIDVTTHFVDARGITNRWLNSIGAEHCDFYDMMVVGDRAMSGAAMTWDDAELSAVLPIVEWLDADVGPRQTVRRANDRGLARTRTIRLRASAAEGLSVGCCGHKSLIVRHLYRALGFDEHRLFRTLSRAQAGAGAGAASLLSRRRADHARRAARAGRASSGRRCRRISKVCARRRAR